MSDKAQQTRGLGNKALHDTAFDAQAVSLALQQRGGLFNRLAFFPSISSTNSWLMASASRQESSHGLVCVADEQTQGRGRRGRVWEGGVAANLQFSLGWKMQRHLDPAIALVVGIAIVRALRRLGVQSLGVKWPNDIMLGRQKVGGILVESMSVSPDEIKAVSKYVIGIGLNFSLDLVLLSRIGQPVTDLASSAYKFSREQACIEILLSLEEVLAEFEVKGLSPFIKEWLAMHIYQDELIDFSHNQKNLCGRVTSINATGALGVMIEGEERFYSSGEIQLSKPVT